MKLFKRTTVALLIFIAIIWYFLWVWVFYPQTHVSLTKEQVFAAEGVLTDHLVDLGSLSPPTKVKALKCAYIYSELNNPEELSKRVLGEGCTNTSKSTYANGQNKLIINNDEMVITGISDFFDKPTTSNIIKKSKKCLNKMGFETNNMTIHSYEKDYGFYLTFTPTYKGKMIFDGILKLKVYKDKTYELRGIPIKILNKKDAVLPKSSYSALTDLALHAEKEKKLTVNSCTLGYKIERDYIIPVWEISTDSETYLVS